ncbi:MAG: hypothetical protein JEZ12_13175 [Desulfobacterium sp.]|nr:hypothetical protein [Desulfobacterium sp.]
MEKKAIIIKTDNLEGEAAPLLFKYDGQCQDQPAYVEIDPRGDTIEVSADYSGEIGNGISAYVWHDLAKRIKCPGDVLGSVLIEHISSPEFNDQVEELCKGFKESWDGSNFKGSWNDQAESQARAIEEELSCLHKAEQFSGEDWIEDDIRYFDALGNPAGSDEATKAKYEDDKGGIEIIPENLDRLVENAEGYIGVDQVVTGLREAFENIIEELKANE